MRTLLVVLCVGCLSLASCDNQKPAHSTNSPTVSANTASEQEPQTLSDPETTKREEFVEEISGVWSGPEDGLVTIDYRENKFRLVIDDSPKAVRLGDVDIDNETANLILKRVSDDREVIWTLRRVWNDDKTAFTLVLVMDEGQRLELGFVRKVTTDDLQRLANLYAASPSSQKDIPTVSAAVATMNGEGTGPDQHDQTSVEKPTDAGETASGTPNPTIPASAGAAAFFRQDYGTALAELVPLAHKNDPIADYFVGVMYLYGRGTEKQPDKALELLRHSADAGVPDAQNYMAAFYRLGSHVNRDYSEAMRWYLQAAKQNFKNAQYRIALMYHQGLGVTQDERAAYKWAYIAAKNGPPEAVAFRDKLKETLAAEDQESIERDAMAWLADIKPGPFDLSPDMLAGTKTSTEGSSNDH